MIAIIGGRRLFLMAQIAAITIAGRGTDFVSKNQSNFLGSLAGLSRGKLAVILILICLTLLLPGFFSLPPVDREGSRFAQASKQMMESEDLIDIRFQDTPKYMKPIGIYWLQASSAALLGNFGFDDKI